MKKNYKALALLIAVLFSSATIGCKANIQVEEHDDPNGGITIEINSDSNSNQTINEDDENLQLDYKVEYTSKHAGEKIIYKKFIVDGGETFATLKVFDKNDKLMWNMTTDTVADWQFPTDYLLGEYDGKIFFKYDTDLAVLNIEDGKEIHRFKNLGNVLQFLTVDDGKLYISKNAGIAGLEKVYVYDFKTFEEIETLSKNSDDYYYEYNDADSEHEVPYINYGRFDEDPAKDIQFEFSVENLIKYGFTKEK